MEIHGGRNSEKAVYTEEVRRTNPRNPFGILFANKLIYQHLKVIHIQLKDSTILDNSIVIDISGQIEKSTRRMPWHMTPMKDASRR